MSWLTQLLQPQTRAVNLDPMDERTWLMASQGGTAASGVYVNAENALRASPVWACTRLLAESVAMLPVIVYRRLPDGGKERAAGHPLYSLLHDSPNALQTSFAFKRTMMTHALLWGNGYARIWPGPRGAVDQLEILHPDHVTVEALPGGGIRYMVRGDDGTERPVNDEDMFHVSGLSLDGVTGLGLIPYAREAIGLTLAASSYSARFYSQNARPGGVLKHPKALNNETARRLRENWQAAHAGLGQAHAVAVLEEGMEWEQTGMTHADAQLVEQLDWADADVARFFNVPLHMIQLMSKSTSWGSGIEEMSIEYVTYSLLPWLRNWEDTIRKDLIVAPQTYFAEFLLEGLLRGKQADRYQAYATGRQWGWLSVNDIRRLENMNPVANGDTYLQPLNMVPAGSPAPVAGHYELLLHETAARVVRKEIAAMNRAARKEGWAQAVAEFYGAHGAFVAAALHVDAAAAEGYAREQAAALLDEGIEVMGDWETRRVADLVNLAKEARANE